MENVRASNSKSSSDFYHVPNLKFDIEKLRLDLEKILKEKKFNSLGIKSFGAIPLNHIPGDEASTKGHNVRGTYWTIPDETGKEAMRDKPIDESKYTELLPEFKGTYFEEVFNTLKENFKLGRIRILLKEPRSTLSWHRDPEPRLHIPIITNKGCRMVIEEVSKHMPADGTVTITNNTKYHNFFNGGEQNRIHLVACVLENPFTK
ncbi:MAG: peptide-aspartate beta-dioxygenase [Candidatus Pelagibacter sp.]|nr:peptide-aspartate beta-dioxygenase [Candidatus Pelagibacter sp.]OUW23975.1 MAG: peptide-aspartate beta-dioxygenase [Rickettsiales bacterium TMED174]|tara:strand:+ start:2185 stop:2799 length:615 start_codon:yes stop_codon:yes gene_type:complete